LGIRQSMPLLIGWIIVRDKISPWFLGVPVIELIAQPSWKLYFFAFILSAAMFFLWRSQPGRKTFGVFLLAIFLSLMIPLVDWLFVTDNEIIAFRLHCMAVDIAKKDWAAVASIFSPNFQTYGGLDRKGVMDLLRQAEGKYGFKKIIIRQLDIRSAQGDIAKKSVFTLRLEGQSSLEVVEIEALLVPVEGNWMIEKVKVFRLLGTDNNPLPI